MRKQKTDKTIEEVTAIIRGSQPKRRKKMRGAMAGLVNEGGVSSIAMRKNGNFTQIIAIQNYPRGAMPRLAFG